MVYFLYFLQNKLSHTLNGVQRCESFMGESVNESVLKTFLDVRETNLVNIRNVEDVNDQVYALIYRLLNYFDQKDFLLRPKIVYAVGLELFLI